MERRASRQPPTLMGVHIDPVTLRARIEAACRDLGIDVATCARIVEGTLDESESRRDAKDRDRLQDEITRARAERERLIALREEIQRRLGKKAHDKVVHDLRNVLNDVALLRMITEDS